MEAGVPFVGPSGSRLADWWAECGLRREDFYITNVLDYQPANIDRVPRDEMERAGKSLHERLAETEGLICVTGNYALYALTGKGKVSWHQRDGRLVRPGITKWRGSILTYVDRKGRTRKVIPTIHPAATFARGSEGGKKAEQYHWVSREWDWPRVAHESLTSEIGLPVREHITAPTLNEVEEFCENIKSGQPIAVDVETPRPNKNSRAYLGCVGIAISSTLSLTIPTTGAYWKNSDTESWARRVLTGVLERAEVIMHNGMFDAFWLAHEDMPVRHFVWDTRAMHATLWPRLPHDLAFVGTTLTRQPYWKDEAKDPDEITRFASNNEALWHYNGIDCCVTFECWERLREGLTDAGLTGVYKRRVANLVDPLLAMTRHGIRVDDARRMDKSNIYGSAQAEAREKINEVIGGDVVTAKGLGTHAIRFALYGAKGLPEKNREANVEKLRAKGIRPLHLPVQYRRAKHGQVTRTVLADEVTIRKLAIRYPEDAGPLCAAVMAFQRAGSLRKQLADGKTDGDGRMRCLFNFVSTRLSSSENPLGTGDNLQNRDRELRDIFVPDPGCVFLKLDMAGIENRIQMMLMRDPEMARLARTPPWELNLHKRNAAFVFKVDEAKVTPEQYQLGKTINHAAMRGMGAKRLQEQLLLRGEVKGLEECQRWLDEYKRRMPALEGYFADIRKQIMRYRCLATTWGDQVSFPYARLDEDIYGPMYSWLPQYEAQGIINNYGVVPWSRNGGSDRLHLQVHDELLFSVQPTEAYDLAVWMQRSLERPRVYFGEAMTVPVTFGLGRTWKIEREWKRLPSREEFVLDV